MDSQRHWASKVRARPLATPVRAAALPAPRPYQAQAPVRAAALPATRPNQTQAPVRAAALPATHHIQTKAPVRAAALPATRPNQTQAPVRAAALPATHPYPTNSSYHVTNARPQPSLQSRLGHPVYMNATSLHHLPTLVSPAVPSSFIDIPTTAVRPAANQVMPLESSSASPLDDLYDFFYARCYYDLHYRPLNNHFICHFPRLAVRNTICININITCHFRQSLLNCTSSPDQEPYSPEISSSVQYIFDQDLIQDEDAEYILPQILGSEAPQSSTPKPQPCQPVVQTPPPSINQPPTSNFYQQIFTALSTFTTTQELLLKEIALNTKSIQTLSTDIAYLRGQVRQFERVQGRQQTILDRLSNLSNQAY
ncbi:unnamed protein product [Mytilus coruscus]|uniref:Uncharacterized protein n=1 Tax=Mytilus coruscus TaxID=42192 RepID=A0A6J8C5V9_MYTCO|nr:unnamed protein product [Mytilus coruscus]